MYLGDFCPVSLIKFILSCFWHDQENVMSWHSVHVTFWWTPHYVKIWCHGFRSTGQLFGGCRNDDLIFWWHLTMSKFGHKIWWCPGGHFSDNRNFHSGSNFRSFQKLSKFWVWRTFRLTKIAVSGKIPKRGPNRKIVKICSFRDFIDFRGSGRISGGRSNFPFFRPKIVLVLGGQPSQNSGIPTTLRWHLATVLARNWVQVPMAKNVSFQCKNRWV